MTDAPLEMEFRDKTGSHDEPASWLALYRAPGVGTETFRLLLQQFSSPDQVLQAPPSELKALHLQESTLQYLKQPDWEAVEKDLTWLAQEHNYLITLDHADYPALLREIPSAPPLLFVHGNPSVLSSLQVAMVGSRNPTPVGAQNAHDFAKHLAQADLVVTSGLAMGIDGASHRGALAAGGITIAVMGTGLDMVYPARHRDLAHEVAERGALVSEFAPGTGSRAHHFPRRNRIISGMSLGTLVVEAALRSGSLITTQHALEQGREVFAIPGSIHNPLARGCHQLIRQGAKLVETADDILAELAPLARASISPNQTHSIANDAHQNKMPENNELDEDYQNLLKIMGYDPITIDSLIEQSGLTPEEVSSMLLILELQGRIASSPGGLYTQLPT
jgi:DNA processing protein